MSLHSEHPPMPPCDHGECPPTHCKERESCAAPIGLVPVRPLVRQMLLRQASADFLISRLMRRLASKAQNAAGERPR